MSKERFKYYYNERVKRYEVFDCYVNLPLSKKGVIETLNDQQDKITDLEAKLAEKDNTITNIIEDNRASQEWYKKQLAEKDEQIKQLNNRMLFSQLQAPKEQILNILGSQCIQHNPDQEKISFAVERLKKVKEKVVKLKDYSRCDKYKECWDIIIDIIIDIDNQIKQLKEGN